MHNELKYDRWLSQTSGDRIPQSATPGCVAKSLLRESRSDDSFLAEGETSHAIGTYQLEQIIQEAKNVKIINPLELGKRYRMITESCGKKRIQMTTGVYGSWKEYAHIPAPEKRLTECCATDDSNLTIDSSWISLEESEYSKGLEQFRKHVRAVEGKDKNATESSVQRQLSDPKTQDMVEYVQTVLPRKPTSGEVRDALEILTQELGIPRDEMPGLTEDVSMVLTHAYYTISTSLRVAWDAYVHQMGAARPLNYQPYGAVVMALGLAAAYTVATMTLGSIIGRWWSDLSNWVHRAWNIKSLRSVSPPSGFPNASFSFLVQGEEYQFSVEVPLMRVFDKSHMNVLQPRKPFTFMGFGRPRWWSGDYIHIVPSVGESRSEEVFVDIKYLIYIQTLDGKMIKDMT